ncbi:MAG: butyrate kinase [Deltaproteobacteria bacterium]|nr:butyrate kinase [Deltaproteobacteria bacterium]
MGDARHRAVLVVNPGGSSTKIALYHGDAEVVSEDVRHSREELARFKSVGEELEWRLATVRKVASERGIDLAHLDAVAGRGGPLAPVPSGTFAVDEPMLAAIREGRVMVHHPSLLGAPMARALADAAGCRAFVVDPVCVDELEDEARLTGLPEIPRRALSHALSVKAAAREAASRLGRPLDELFLVILHLGSGFTVAASRLGRQVDANDASASGPMAPTRSGSLPTLDFARLACAGGRGFEELERRLVGNGGWMAHLGTDDIREIYARIDTGDARARLVLDATLLQIAKEAAAMAAVLRGRIDAVVITGGVARSERFVKELSPRIAWLGAPLVLLPGGNEMRALARGALRVLSGEAEAIEMGPYIEKRKKEAT